MNGNVYINKNFGDVIEDVGYDRRNMLTLWGDDGKSNPVNHVYGRWRRNISISGNFNLNFSNVNFSPNETRPKTKFYNLLIYAGYPNK